jgi:hypothetical protein
MFNRNTRALLGALVLALALPATTLAASTSQTASESLSVASSITLSGVPASLAYGANSAGGVAAVPEFAMTVSSNAANGWFVAVNASDLTSGGGGTIAASNREYVLGCTGCTATGGGSPVAYTPDLVLATRGSAGDGSVFTTSRIHIPSAAPAGSYTGSAIFTATTN